MICPILTVFWFKFSFNLKESVEFVKLNKDKGPIL